jgi:hypothetical protein
MPQSRETPQEPKILFCPFCRDGFEGVAECPEHELTLLPIDRMPRLAERSFDEVAFFADPRLGRGGVLLGAVLVAVGFLAPFVHARGLDASALEVAIDGAHNLWLTPGAAVGVLGVLWRRRSAPAMRGARLAVLGLALAGALPLVYTSRRIGLVAEVYAAEVEWRWGLAAMAAGLVVAALSSAGLGASRWPAGD